jgi:glutamine synthetase
VSWSRQNRSQLVRIPQVKGNNCRMELRSPDPACNPYLAVALVLAAGLDGIEHRMVLQAPINKNLFDPAEAAGLGLERLPSTLEEAVQAALTEVKQSRSAFRAASAAKLQEQREKLDAEKKNAEQPES